MLLLALDPSGEQILAYAKQAFRSHVRPAYVSYLVERRDRVGGLPDLENSYDLKVWCRTSDRDALMRKAWNGKAYGELINDTVAFDGYVDPGPPTADIFERALYVRAPLRATPAPDATELPTIGTVTTVGEYDYRVTRLQREGALWHLSLSALRDLQRNRIEQLWVNATTYDVTRMFVRDHLYLGLTGQSLPDEFDVRFTMRDGLPLISAIHGVTFPPTYQTDYVFRDVTFPETLPAWYFEPKTYREHRGEAPA